jgi:uncharacterized protein YpmS
MSKVITFDKGSKRRLEQIQWKIGEIFSLALLTVFVMAVSILVLLWEMRHEHPYSEPSKVPQIKEAEPTTP